MSATAGTATLSTSESSFFEDAKGATQVFVRAAAVNALVHIPGLHADGDFVPLPSEQIVCFSLEQNGIKKIIGKTSSGSVSVTFGTTKKTTSGHR